VRDTQAASPDDEGDAMNARTRYREGYEEKYGFHDDIARLQEPPGLDQESWPRSPT
jgi:hypothetical protein